MSDKNSKVDVVIPTFQREDSLFRAIDSALIQGECINRIWVIDDGSTKEIQSRIQSRYLNHEIVKVVLLEHSGIPGRVRKVGVEKSIARWIAFLDSDDCWDPGKINRQLEFAEKSGAKAVTCNARVVKNGQDFGLFHASIPQKLNFKQLLRTNLIINSMLMVERQELLKVGTYADSDKIKAVEDYATWLRLSCNIQIFVLEDDCGIYEISETSVRRFDHTDPRIFAFADFLVWSNLQHNNLRLRRKKKLVLKSLVREYVR